MRAPADVRLVRAHLPVRCQVPVHRAQRAHVNCVENLPIFATVVVIGHLIGVTAPMFATCAIVVVVGRVGQSIAHISSGRALVTNIRFMFFSAQVVALIAMGALIVLHA